MEKRTSSEGRTSQKEGKYPLPNNLICCKAIKLRPLRPKGALEDSSNADPELEKAAQALVFLKASEPTAWYKKGFLSISEPAGNILVDAEDEGTGCENEEEIDELAGNLSSETGDEGTMKFWFLVLFLCSFDCHRPWAAFRVSGL